MYVGSITGNITGTLYLLAYQVLGILIAFRIIKNDKMIFKDTCRHRCLDALDFTVARYYFRLCLNFTVVS